MGAMKHVAGRVTDVCDKLLRFVKKGSSVCPSD
jgi:hypothetical protein